MREFTAALDAQRLQNLHSWRFASPTQHISYGFNPILVEVPSKQRAGTKDLQKSLPTNILIFMKLQLQTTPVCMFLLFSIWYCVTGTTYNERQLKTNTHTPVR